MQNPNESDKSKLVKGSLHYLWEEIKTLNGKKLRALGAMISGYLGLKFRQKNQSPR